MKFFKKAFLLSLILIAVVVTLTSCSGKKKVTLSAEQSEINVIIGEAVELKLSATEVKKYSEEDILSNLDITSSDENVVKIENDGLIAVGLGTANVTATWKEYERATVTVKVNVLAPEVGSVTYSELPAYVYVGDTFQITHEAASDVTVSYATSNADVLSVEDNNFEAKAVGTVKITATATNGYKEVKKEWDVEVLQGEFTITYVLNGGRNSSSNPAKYDVRELPLALAAATKTNKKFLGWSLEENSSEYVTEIATGQTGDITLYANFADIVHEITYVLDGGTNPADAPTSFVQGVGTKLPTPTKEGYVFLGWKLVANGAYITEIAASRKTAAEVTAYWEKEVVYSNIVYELNGGTNATGAPTQYAEGTGCNLPTPTKDGYTFLGWTKEAEGSSYVTAIGADATGEFKVYAQWKLNPIKHEITYELNGGTNPEGAPVEFEEGTVVTLPTPTKAGYTFLGWTKEETGTAYVTEIAATETADVKVYAQWEERVVIEGAVYVGEGLDYATLDEAVEGVTDGAKIVLAAGEYSLSKVITKNITIFGPNADKAVVDFSSAEAIINVKSGVAGNVAAKEVVFNGVHLKGIGGGPGITGVYFQDGGNVESLQFLSCVVSDMNTFVKFNISTTSNLELLIQDCHIHTIGQFAVWTTSSIKNTKLLNSRVDGAGCGSVTNSAAALFRIRCGVFEAYNNYFNGDSYNEPGYFESIAETSYVKYNTFENVTKFAHPTASNKLVFDQNLYLDANGKALDSAPSSLAVTGVTVDTSVCSNEVDRESRYMNELISLYPDRYFKVEYDLVGGELTTAAPTVYDKEAGIESLPLVEKEGYIFLGWYLDGNKVESVAAGTSGNIKLVAKWRETALVVDGTTDEGHYENLAAALADVKEGETIKLVAGEYAENVTVSVANISIIGPNVGVAGNSASRVAEAVVSGVITVDTSAKNLIIDGIKFTGAARVIGTTGAYTGFTFQNNLVADSTLTAAAYGATGRYVDSGFINFSYSAVTSASDFVFNNNKFDGVAAENIHLCRNINLSVDNNEFYNYTNDCIRIDGGYVYGVLSFTNNKFENDAVGKGQNAVYFRSYSGSSNTSTTLLFKGNEFIKCGGLDKSQPNSGTIGGWYYQENGSNIIIEENIFDHCYNGVYFRNNGAAEGSWSCEIKNNIFLGLPTDFYYQSYNGTGDTESTNPHLTVFGANYYEDNSGTIVTDLTLHASLFKHCKTSGTALSSKPAIGEAEVLEFWIISYELNGGTTRDSFVYSYTSLDKAVIALPTLTLPNHQFNGWLLNGELVTEIPATATGDLVLIADFSVLEGEIYTIEFVTNKQNVIWPSRAAVDRTEIVNALLADLYEWAVSNGETKSYADYETYILAEIAAYNDINLRNTELGNYPAEDGSTEFFFNVPKYYQKWSDFFAAFNTAMLAVNPTQVFYTDTYASMVRLHQFISWSSTGEKYFAAHLSAFCKATKIPQEIPSTYRGGQIVTLPELSLANGLEFLGWYDNAEFTGNAITTITSTDTGNKVYYAKWADEIKVETIEVNKISELLLFETHQLVWTLTPSNATDLSVEFFSSDESVATISSKGLITAIANGKTTITIKVYGNRELDVVFELTVFTNDYINGEYETNSYVLIDESINLLAEVIRKDGSKGTVTWSSATPEIATVDATGKVTALNAGTAKIVATDSANADLKLEFSVTVLEAMPEDILGLAVRSNEANVFSRYDLTIGGSYTMDIIGSVSKLFANSPLTKDTTYYEQANASTATFGTMSSIEFITVHYTGNMATGADANANAKYFANTSSVSIHYTTGNDGVFYCLDESKSAWHAGDSGALAQVGEFKWIPSGVKVGANDPMYPSFTISTDFYYEINGQKTTIPMPLPYNYNSRNTDHILNADGTISSKEGYGQAAFTNRSPESFINDQSLPFKIVDGEYYMGTTWWAYTQVYEGRICSTGGNRNSIGIESCVDKGSDLWWTWQKTAQLVADLMVRHNLDITRVRGHHFYTAKNCPQPMLENDLEIWWEFLELVEAEYELLTKYQGYEVSIVSNNPDIVDNYGRVIKQPNVSTCVSYTMTFTKDGESKSITLASMVDGKYVNR